ncbi:hypothetical protein [Moritella dasanensis]|jgi:hypothetical protein|uniref:hypothetical protein n=1 Tax=Moritella dasanensis TaxID=428031 RepID=UPI00031958DD|nr:hypothetical protein [Moritella dasanensis]
MKKPLWTKERIAQKGSVFLQSVLNNMGSKSLNATVRFGTTGTGDLPNYQVKKEFGPIAPDRHLITVYQSRSHKKYTGTAVFNEDNLSEEFTYADIIEMLANDIKGMLADDNIHS